MWFRKKKQKTRNVTHTLTTNNFPVVGVREVLTLANGQEFYAVTDQDGNALFENVPCIKGDVNWNAPDLKARVLAAKLLGFTGEGDIEAVMRNLAGDDQDQYATIRAVHREAHQTDLGRVILKRFRDVDKDVLNILVFLLARSEMIGLNDPDIMQIMKGLD